MRSINKWHTAVPLDVAQHNTYSADDLYRGLHAISHKALATMLCVLIDCVVVAALGQNQVLNRDGGTIQKAALMLT